MGLQPPFEWKLVFDQYLKCEAMAKPRVENASVERVQQLLDYDPATGLFLWLISRGRQRAGSVAGSVTSNGYRYIAIDGKFYLAQRLAWFMMTGTWPEFEVDHEDRNRDHNWWTNLRSATSAQNKMNASIRSDNKSGCRGVHFQTTRSKWRALIQRDNKPVWLGDFETKEDAVMARRAALPKYHGEFAV